MPITIIPGNGVGYVGPGVFLTLQSSFVGPFTATTQWDVSIDLLPEGGESVRAYRFRNQLNVTGWQIDGDPNQIGLNGQFTVQTGDTVHIIATLSDGGTVLDSGAITATWDPVANLGLLLQTLVQQTGTGHFTTTDRTALDNVNTQVNLIEPTVSNIVGMLTATVQTAAGAVQTTFADWFSGKTLDLLTLEEITAGCSAGPVAADLSNKWCFGIIVRICTIPPTWAPRTPSGEWYFPTLATMRIFRGTDVIKAVAVHSPDHFEAPLPGYFSALLPSVLSAIQPPLTSVEVDFADGVTGQVFRVFMP